MNYSKFNWINAAWALAIVLFYPGSGIAELTKENRTFTEVTVASKAPPVVKVRVQEAYGKLPLQFEANQGQTDPQVRFLSRGNGYALFLTPGGAVLSLRRPYPADGPERAGGTSILRMTLMGANPAPKVEGRDPLSGKSSYFIGSDPAKWHTSVPHYEKVEYKEVYPGVDLVFYGNQRRLEYDFIVRPGADPSAIRMEFEGTEGMALDKEGNLILTTPGGEVVQRKPHIYQEVAGVRHEIPGGYVLNPQPVASNPKFAIRNPKSQLVGFQVAAYDASKPLVIDPVLLYSTYLGGNNQDRGLAIAVDANGNAYVTGATSSADFPTTAGAFDRSCGTDGTCNRHPVIGDVTTDAFVAKINPSGTALVYSTFLGGSGNDGGNGIAVDASGNVYVALGCLPDFPTTPGAYQRVYYESFCVAKLDASGSALTYSTFVTPGGQPTGIAVDASGNAYVTGATGFTDFPTTEGAFQRVNGGHTLDAFVMKLNASGSALVYSTFLGGSAYDIATGIAVDASGNAYVTGRTSSSTGSNTFPTTANAFQPAPRSTIGAFFTKLNASGSALLYSTHLGGGSTTGAAGIAVDASGHAYVTGSTFAEDFPTTLGAFQRVCASCGGAATDAFVAKINPSQSGADSLVYSTYLGGNNNDNPGGIVVDASRNAYVTGTTRSTDFPRNNPCAPCEAHLGDYKGFVTKLNASGSGLVYSTYLTGSGFETAGLAIALDTSGNAYVTGYTNSPDFSGTADSPIQPVYGGGQWDAFVAKIGDAQSLVTTGNVVVGTELIVGNTANGSATINAPRTFSRTTVAKGDGVNPVTGSLTVTGSGKLTNTTTTGAGLQVGVESGTQGTVYVTSGGEILVQPTAATFVGRKQGSTGTIEVTGTNSYLDAGASLLVGRSGFGDPGFPAGGTGHVTASSGGSIAADQVIIGLGDVRVQSGGRVESSIASVGRDAGATGAVEISGAGSLWEVSGPLPGGSTRNVFHVGRSGVGTLQITDGGHLEIDGSYQGGSNPGAASTVGFDVGGEGAIMLSGPGSTLELTGPSDTSQSAHQVCFDDGLCFNTTLGVRGVVGYRGKGSLVVEDGAKYVAKGTNVFTGNPEGFMIIGRSESGEGSVMVSGVNLTSGEPKPSLLEVATRIRIGLYTDADTGAEEVGGTGSLSVCDGAVVETQEIRIGPKGKFNATGAYSGSIVNLGGTVSPGCLRGNLTIDGSYESVGGKLILEVDQNSDHDVLEIVGSRSFDPSSEIEIHVDPAYSGSSVLDLVTVREGAGGTPRPLLSVTVPMPGIVLPQGELTRTTEVTIQTNPAIPPTRFALIDIKPGSFPNSINLRSEGSVPVAILSTVAFDVPAEVDPGTIMLQGATVKLVGKARRPQCSSEDVNGDGLMDLVCHVSTQELQIKSGATLAVLEAKTRSGMPIMGADSIRIVPR